MMKCLSRPAGFTLIEVLLAITLSAFLVAMITSAIYVNITVVQRQQAVIERSQIARNVLMMIKSDIRAAIQYKPADVTGLDSLTVSQAAIAGIAGDAGIDTSALGSTMGDMTGTGGTGDAGSEADADRDETDNTQNIASGQTQVLRPGLYGNSTEIMIDISRLPRLDQYDPLVTGNEQGTQLPTDVKTISWFVSEFEDQSFTMSVGTDTSANGGLYRRQLDRAVASYSSDLAVALASLGNTKLIANEITQIEFRYFDGETWQQQWDSDQQGGFPSAVEVSIRVQNEREISEEASYRMTPDPDEGEVYRSVIYLPVAEILPEDELEQMNGGGG